MTPIQAIVGALIAYGLIVAAVAGLAGPFWAMLAAGGLLLVAVVLLYDPVQRGKAKK